MGDPEPVGLAEAIGTVRAELARAQAEGAASDWRFSVEQVSLEFSVQFHRAGEGGAGLRLGVVEARLGGTVSHDSTHRIQVDLKPLPGPAGHAHEVSRDDVPARDHRGPEEGSLSRDQGPPDGGKAPVEWAR
ncbi:trypco2 family protein [Streptomyces sp. NPDC012510]|uniref:trypco2 family protein n=1 Tax=Streptomyces sp. NPDC012510 TaxID=3364838 RepID=UPI0036EA432C